MGYGFVRHTDIPYPFASAESQHVWMGEDLSPAGAVLQWPLRHDILLLPVGAPWICRLGGHFAPLGNPFLLFISFYFNFRNDDLSNIQLGSLADQVSKSDKV